MLPLKEQLAMTKEIDFLNTTQHTRLASTHYKIHIYAHRKSTAASDHRTRNPAITCPMCYRYTT